MINAWFGKLQAFASTCMSYAGAAALMDSGQPYPEAPILQAAAKGDLPRVRALLAGNADVDARNNHQLTPLMLAARRGHQDVVRALLAAGATVNAVGASGATAFNLAALYGHMSVARLLIQARADVKLVCTHAFRLDVAEAFGD